MSNQPQDSSSGLPHLETPLGQCLFEGEFSWFNRRFDKLMVRLGNCSNNKNIDFTLGSKLLDVLELRETDLMSLQGVGKEYVETLKKLKSFYRDGEEVDVFPMPLNEQRLPSLDTLLKDCLFNNDFDKLLCKIEISSIDSDFLFREKTISDLLSLSEEYLLSMPSVGKYYVGMWRDLVSLYSKEFSNIKQVQYLNTDGMVLRYSRLSQSEKRHFRKLCRHLKRSATLSDIVNFDRLKFEGLPSFGDRFITTILELQAEMRKEIIQFSKEDNDRKSGKYVSLCDVTALNLEEIGHLLLEDIDDFLDGLEEKDQTLFQKRYGFIEPQQTLEELGKMNGYTKERIRQIEKKILYEFKLSLRVSPEQIRTAISGKSKNMVAENMKYLSECFFDEKSFCRFLEDVCDSDALFVALDSDMLDILKNLFAWEGAPCSYFDVENYFNNVLSSDIVVETNGILKYLENKKVIRLEGDKIFPVNLPRHDGIACVLATHPEGLPWRDIVNIVNENVITKKSLSQNRLGGAFFNSDTVYLAGKGVYRHVKFIDFEKIDIERIFRELRQILLSSDRDSFHLSEVRELSSMLSRYDYYVLRYIVKMNGEDYGVYFKGKSQTDSIGIKKHFKGVTQKDMILDYMRKHKKTITVAEVAKMLKSKSLVHASLYLNKLMSDKEIVRVDRMLYVVPELAYEKIEKDACICNIRDILLKESKVVHESMFQEFMNEKMCLSHSKYFYSSMARYYASEIGLYFKQSLYSLAEIPYEGLRNVIETHCDFALGLSENIKLLQQHIAITEYSAQYSIRNWKKGSAILD